MPDHTPLVEPAPIGDLLLDTLAEIAARAAATAGRGNYHDNTRQQRKDPA